MKISFTPKSKLKAKEDVIEIYKLAEERIKRSCIGYDSIELRNAFQVFRYAFREWASLRDRGVVLRALFVADSPVREVRQNFSGVEFHTDDPVVAEAIEHILRGDGYSEESN